MRIVCTRGGTIAVALALACAGQAGAQTTVDQTIVGDEGAAYSTLSLGPGWERVVREELAPAQAGREDRRDPLLYFAQMSDMHIIDEESPARVELLDLDGTPFTSAWRPHEAFGPHMNDYAVRGINRFTSSPVTGEPLEFAITTGDSADNMQHNETGWVVKLLEGGTLDPNSGVEPDIPCGTPPGEAERYTGVQDFDDYLETDYFYDPDHPAGRHAAWPRYPGLMDRAQQPFEAEGLAVPSYVAFGNHDGLAQGNNAAIAPYEAVGTGCVKPMGPLPPGGDLTATLLQTTPSQLVTVPPDEGRRFVNKPQYRALHDTGAQADAHGFGFIDPAESAASRGHASYYAWSPKPGFRFISLDTVAEGGVLAPEGNIDEPQFRWLRGELQEAQAAGELAVVFGHHPIRSLTVNQSDEAAPPCLLPDRHGHDINPGCDLDPRSSTPLHLGQDLKALLLAHPNAIAYVAGHTHEHNITPFSRPGGGGFWDIETAAEIDWPLQSRLLDVVDNGDGTLSILGTVIDQASPVGTPPPGTAGQDLTPAQLAALGREFSFNDPQTGAGTSGSGVGDPQDRNVELLLPDPRD
ncbi:MAG: TIGR03767 family metallophosphoesterase [Thermoleophilaceae bacterium]